MSNRPVKKLGISQVIYNMESKKLGMVGIIYLRSWGAYKITVLTSSAKANFRVKFVIA